MLSFGLSDYCGKTETVEQCLTFRHSDVCLCRWERQRWWWPLGQTTLTSLILSSNMSTVYSYYDD